MFRLYMVHGLTEDGGPPLILEDYDEMVKVGRFFTRVVLRSSTW